MKKTILFLFILITEPRFAQSTEILPGLVLPQMTTAQRVAMVSPANGHWFLTKLPRAIGTDKATPGLNYPKQVIPLITGRWPG